MKKLILTLTIMLLAFAASAQKYTCTTKDEIRQLADSIALNSRAYIYDKEAVSQDNQNIYIVQYKNTADEKLSVAFRIENVGENAALETKGTEQYTFYRATGKFLDLFPYWQTINPNANKETIATAKSDRAEKGNYILYFKELGDFWVIEFHPKKG
jgi:hypothetical protein